MAPTADSSQTVERSSPTRPEQSRSPWPSGAERFGSLVAIAVNAVMLYVVNNLLDWGWPSFLTQDFDNVLPAVNLTLVASIIIQVGRFWYNPKWFVAATELISTALGLRAAVRLYRVFPFDFTSYSFRWDLGVKAVLIIAIIGSVIGIVVNLVRLLRALVDV